MRFIKKLLPQSFKNIYHLLQAVLANFRYGFPACNAMPVRIATRSIAGGRSIAGRPSRKIRVIGVTGTDGKTTTSQMIVKILQEAGKKVALASTINFVINGKEEKNLSHYTTESAFALQKFIRRAVDAGCQYLVLETSSHSLDQSRVWGVNFDVAVITNVTREHLDYHKTMEKYRLAKKKLFEIVAKNNGTFVVNLDMEKPEEFLKFEAGKKFGYTTKIENVNFKNQNDNAKIKIINAEEIELGINYSKFKIQSASWRTKFTLNIPGLFNIENALAATSVALGEGIDLEVASGALSKIKGVAGRMEAVENDLGLNILVDFALTPNALEKLYSLLFNVKKEDAKIIAILGSCGDRDQGKRPLMGEIVAKYADMVILTNEEPYHEEPQAIIDQIFAGVIAEEKCENAESNGSSNFQFPISNFQTNSNDRNPNHKIKRIEGQNCWRILDRREAIAKALKIAKKDDIICITGMGSFETMVVGDEKLPWNDRKVIEEELGKVL